MNDSDYYAFALTCCVCQQTFVFEAGEQRYFAERGYRPPARCPACRLERKQRREAAQEPPTARSSAPR